MVSDLLLYYQLLHSVVLMFCILCQLHALLVTGPFLWRVVGDGGTEVIFHPLRLLRTRKAALTRLQVTDGASLCTAEALPISIKRIAKFTTVYHPD